MNIDDLWGKARMIWWWNCYLNFVFLILWYIRQLSYPIMTELSDSISIFHCIQAYICWNLIAISQKLTMVPIDEDTAFFIVSNFPDAYSEAMLFKILALLLRRSILEWWEKSRCSENTNFLRLAQANFLTLRFI